MSEIERQLRNELKEQIEENKGLLKINEEHKKINGDLRKENDALITVIDLVKHYIATEPLKKGTEAYRIGILEILERVNEE